MESIMVLLGIGFIVGGGMKVTDPSQAIELFRSWGIYAPWLVSFSGWTEVVLGLSLLNRPTRPAGALGLGLWMLIWGAVQVAAGSVAAFASGAVLVLCAAFLLKRRGAMLPESGWLASPLTESPDLTLRTVHRLVRIVGIAFLIRWAVGGMLYWTALPVLALWSHPREPESHSAVEVLLLHLLVLGLGVSGLWGFVGHTFLAESISQAVGWPPSPFQSELAFYHLGIGIAGIACWWFRDHFWVAAAAIPSIFLYGAGWVHLSDYLRSGNAAEANWGFPVLFGNLIVPTLLLALTVLRARRRN